MSGITKKLILVLIPLIAILAGGITLLLVLSDSKPETMYVEQLNSARKFREEGEYQKAIVYYKQAIENGDADENAYLELADIYFMMQKSEDGFAVLRLGYEQTKSNKILELLKQNDYDFAAEQPVTQSTKDDTPPSKVSVNNVNARIFSSYTYEKYNAEYTKDREFFAGAAFRITYVQFDAEFEYADSEQNKVLDPKTNRPYAYARPTAINMHNLSLLFSGIENGASLEQLKSSGLQNVKVGSYNAEHDCYLLTAECNGMHLTIGCDKDGHISGPSAYNMAVPPAGEAKETKVTVNGRVTDATSGAAVGSAMVKIRKGKNSRSGSVAANAAVTNGSFRVELEPGDYTAEVTADGYSTEYFDLYVPENNASTDVSFTISPSLAANEVRFVLEWGATPPDLDAHLTGTIDGTTVNVNYITKTATKNGTVLADLDVDNRQGYGPETITMHKTNGKVEYRVHRYSFSGSIAQSGATVKIYTSNSAQPIILAPPDDVNSEWWTVCTVENGVVGNINGKRL